MNCAVVVPTLFSPSNSFPSNNINNIPMSPSNNSLVLKFQHHNVHNDLPLLKRKRPAKINVPITGFSNSLFGDSIVMPRDQVDQEVEIEGDGYGVYSKRGTLRARIEDRYSVFVNDHISNNSNKGLFGIFDGHGGSKAAEFAASRLGKNILDHVGELGRIETKQDEEVMKNKIRDGYLATDNEFLSSENAVGGTCCVTALIKHGKLAVSNAGDCRAVLSRRGVAEALTFDHTPARQDEKMRIESNGGFVDCCNGVWRIQGSLAVSRAVGDRHLKQWVIAEPDTKVVDIRPDCDFLILASDGLWNKVSTDEAVNMVHTFCKTAGDKPELARACRKLAELAISRGSGDDISVMIIHLVHFANY